MVAFGVAGLLFAAVTKHLVESARLSNRIAHTLEHSCNARELIDKLSTDVRAAQILRLHPDFTDRSTIARDSQPGNYLVLHFIDGSGHITRTVGYYVASLGENQGWALYRHDSAHGDSAAGELPASGTSGRHRLVKRAERLPDANQLFRSVRDRGVSIHGEFGVIEPRGLNRTEFIRCTISTRS
jgi:hypothetical protein